MLMERFAVILVFVPTLHMHGTEMKHQHWKNICCVGRATEVENKGSMMVECKFENPKKVAGFKS